MIERCVLVSLVTITWASPSPTRTSCRWIDENTSINRCVVGRAHGRASGYNGNDASPARAIAWRNSRSSSVCTSKAKKYAASKP